LIFFIISTYFEALTNNEPMELTNQDKAYQQLLKSIGAIFQEGQMQAVQAVNTALLQTYWQVGKYVIEFEQGGNVKAEYGKKLLVQLSKDLKLIVNKGFSRSNLIYARLLYVNYPISQTLSDQLSWSHYCEILSIEDNLERSFYEKQSVIERWSVRELRRQKDTALFQRLALSKSKEEIWALAKQGYVPKQPKEIVKDPYIFEFLGMGEKDLKKESQLEERLIDNLQSFLMELGKGFTFVGRQYRITLANEHFFVDLVFYHRILKCFVLIDLKVRKVKHTDIGQMNMYINYFKTEENVSDDNEPIGIILTAQKDEILVEYALGGITNNLFVSRYQLYLPDKQQLEQQIKNILENQSLTP
jgi:predicted nuclease of restriction endonuclease-like (RecB) superfamily